MAAKLRTFEARDLAAWKEWLAANHQSESEVWLLFYHRESGRACVSYDDALDEALCFGWIDSLVKHLDEQRYARKFTPRKPESKWSTANRKRYARLEAGGRLMPAGRERPPTARSGDAPRPAEGVVPGYILEALREHPAALRFFDSLAPSYRRLYIAWIDSAKQAETKSRRLKEAIGLLSQGEKLGLK